MFPTQRIQFGWQGGFGYGQTHRPQVVDGQPEVNGGAVAIAMTQCITDIADWHALTKQMDGERMTQHMGYAKRDAKCSPVAMLGASQRIHADALPMFAGKRVRIFGHEDEAGRAAVERWARQLESIVADVDAFTFAGLVQVDGKPVKDLNDSLLMDAASLAQAERLLP